MHHIDAHCFIFIFYPPASGLRRATVCVVRASLLFLVWFSMQVVYQLSMNTECLPTHLVATFLLMYRQGITRDHLIENFEWLRKQVSGAIVYRIVGRGFPDISSEGHA